MKPNLSSEIQELAEHQASLCRAFSNPQHVLILWLLAEREQTVTEIARAIGVHTVQKRPGWHHRRLLSCPHSPCSSHHL